jgi:hypothetical protein
MLLDASSRLNSQLKIIRETVTSLDKVYAEFILAENRKQANYLDQAHTKMEYELQDH